MLLKSIFRLIIFCLSMSVFFTFADGQSVKSKNDISSRNKSESVRFALGGDSALNILFELSNNLILLPVRINDSPQPVWFIFDTGASASIIDTELAKKLNLKPRGKERGNATGGAIEAEIFSGVSLTVSGVSVFNQTVAALPVAGFSAVLGKPIGGIIGYDFIRQFVVEIDYDAQKMNLYAPKSYRRNVSGAPLPVKFINNKPFVNARLKLRNRHAVKGLFMIDTGADMSLTVNSPFVRSRRLLETLTDSKKSNLGGVGGVSESVTARIENIRIGRFTIANPLADFSQAAEGSDALKSYAGVLGGEVFRRFTLILDYSRRRIVFQPNKHLSEPFEANISGIELIADGADFNKFVINDVEPNSPAAEAGLKEEDELLEIDRRPASEISLEKIRQMLKQNGREYLLSIRRGAQILQIKIKLKRLT